MGMHATKENRGALGLFKFFKETTAGNVCALLDASARLFIPWIGLGCAHKAAQETTDVDLLLKLVLRDSNATLCLEDAEDESCWRQIVELAISGIARNIIKAAKHPEFRSIGEDLLEQIVLRVEAGTWIEETFHIELAEDAERRRRRSQHGVSLLLNYGDRFGEQGLLVVLFLDKDAQCSRTFIAIEEKKIWIMPAAKVTVKARTGEDKCLAIPEESIATDQSLEYKLLQDDEVLQFAQGDPATFAICLEMQTSRAENQIMALQAFYADSNDTEGFKLYSMWRHFRNSGQDALAEVCREVICMSFSPERYMDISIMGGPPVEFPDLWRSLTCSEVESIISHDNLKTKAEIQVLNSVLFWVKHKHDTTAPMHAYRVGEEVRICQDKHLRKGIPENWRGADCLILESDDTSPAIKLERICATGSPKSTLPETIELAHYNVRDAVETSMRRLLQRVRWDYISIEDWCAMDACPGYSTRWVDRELRMFAAQFECFLKCMEHVVQVRTGVKARDTNHEWARPRAGYSDLMVRVEFDATRIIMDMIRDECVVDDTYEQVRLCGKRPT